jgi:hypothetical protein
LFHLSIKSPSDREMEQERGGQRLGLLLLGLEEETKK